MTIEMGSAAHQGVRGMAERLLECATEMRKISEADT
jgi:hypothetical protein